MKTILIKFVYQRVGYLLGDSENRRLPTRKDDLTLANEFTQYFVDKVNTIRSNIEKDLDGNTHGRIYTTGTNNDISLTSFQSLSEGAVFELVNEMKTKLKTKQLLIGVEYFFSLPLLVI